MFADLVGFTGFCQTHAPEEAVAGCTVSPSGSRS